MAKHNWTKEEYETLRKTGTVPGRSKEAIRRVKVRLGLKSKQAVRREWTQEETDKLIALHQEGHTAHSIFAEKLLPFTINAMQKKLCRLGLAKKIEAVKFSQEWRDKLRAFLRENWANRTPEELAEMWNAQYPFRAITDKRVASYLTQMNLKLAYGEVQRINRQREREKKIWQDGKRQPLAKTLENLRLSRADFMRGRLERRRDLWSGIDLTPEFMEQEKEVFRVFERKRKQENGHCNAFKTTVDS